MTDQLRTFFENYCETYNRFNPTARRIHHPPACDSPRWRSQCLQHAQEVGAFFAKLLEWFTGIRHGKGSISSFEVRSLGTAALSSTSSGEAPATTEAC